ncbi:MAG: hypothetical protein QM756_34235 [Polyangiaceae bacterium]
MTQSSRVQALLTLTIGLALLALPLSLLATWQHLPDPLAVRWSFAGNPLGSHSKLGYLALLSALCLVCASVMREALRRPSAGALGAGLSVATTLLFAHALVLRLNWDRQSFHDAGRLTWPFLLGLLAAPLCVALIARRLTPNVASASSAALELAAGERAYWTGRAENAWLRLAALAAACWAALSAFQAHWHTALLVAIVALLAEACSSVRVSVDEHRVTLHFGSLGWLRQRFALSRVHAASALELRPLQHGGWGYRGSLLLFGRAAVVVRSGPALRLALDVGRTLTVSVDDATTAAKLINGFLQRQGRLRHVAVLS